MAFASRRWGPAVCSLLTVLAVLSQPAVPASRDPSVPEATNRVAGDLQAWASVMEMFRFDDGAYPTASSISGIAADARRRGYWEQPVERDPVGRPYSIISAGNRFRVSAADGQFIESRASGGGRVPPGTLPERAEATPEPAQPAFEARAAAGPGTMLTVSKSGDDIVLSWTGAGTLYDGARATDAPFTNATTQFAGFGGTSHTYIGALSNPRNVEFFDVTDETESNRAGNWNGGVLPPPPPVIDAGDPSTNIGSLFIGSVGTIVGTGFSIIPETNAVCFNGGVCTQATSAFSTQIQFVTPPGAQTGRVTVTVGGQTSEPANSTVTLEDPASGWLIRTIGFSRQNKSYWMAGTASAVNSLYRVFYNTGTGKWSREDRGGAFSGNSHFCSTQTSRTGRLFCGLSTLTTGGGGARVAETEPPSNLASCINLGGAGNNSNVRGAAADPNPAAAGGRDVVYFAHAIDSVPASYRIKKVAADCSTILDSDFGNTNWSGLWNAIVGMAVDPVTGDLYIAAKTDVYRVAPDESLLLVKGGFTSVNGIDVAREGANDPGVLLVADGGTANTVKAVPLDNTGAAPITVATASILRASTFGALVSGGPWLATNVNRTIVIHNNGNSGAVNPLRPHPLVEVTPVGPFEVRISSPSATEQLPDGQSRMRPSTYQDTSFSNAVTRLQYRDGLSRFTCAWVGDPGAGAAQYDPAPAVPSDCNKPRSYAAANCDNKHDIVVGGPGSFMEGGNPIQSCKMCGGTFDPCVWEFRITNRFGGDNYKVYFAFDQSSEQFPATSDIYTAWKHVHIERERMCNVGGILFEDYGATGQCGAAGQPACCGTAGQPPCNQILMYDPSNVSMGQSLVVFDELNPYETAGYTRTVTAPPANNGDGSVTLTLDSPLPRSYQASAEFTPGMVPHVPDFVNGHSGGVCVPLGGFVEADLSDLRQGFDHALVDYHIPTYGLDGAGVVPRLWPEFLFDLTNHNCAARRFSRIWYSRFVDGGDVGCPVDPPDVDAALENNVFHVIPAFDTIDASNPAGFSAFEGAFSYILDEQIAQDCAMSSGGCTGTEQDAMRRWTVAHETAHQFRVNKCSPPLFHDSPSARAAWCGASGGSCVVPPASTQSCVMVGGTSVPELDMRADGTDHFCKEDLALGDPNCSGTPREGAIRTWEDPQ